MSFQEMKHTAYSPSDLKPNEHPDINYTVPTLCLKVEIVVIIIIANLSLRIDQTNLVTDEDDRRA